MRGLGAVRGSQGRFRRVLGAFQGASRWHQGHFSGGSKKVPEDLRGFPVGFRVVPGDHMGVSRGSHEVLGTTRSRVFISFLGLLFKKCNVRGETEKCQEKNPEEQKVNWHLFRV